MAGDLVTIAVFAGSFIRPVGGYMADRIGGIKLLNRIFLIAAILLALIGFLPSLYVAVTLIIAAMLVFGISNGAMFQVIPTRFPKEVGIFTGFVGAAGGFGGFFLPNILGIFKEFTESYAFGFWWIGGTFFIALMMILWLINSWKKEDEKRNTPNLKSV